MWRVRVAFLKVLCGLLWVFMAILDRSDWVSTFLYGAGAATLMQQPVKTGPWAAGWCLIALGVLRAIGVQCRIELDREMQQYERDPH